MMDKTLVLLLLSCLFQRDLAAVVLDKKTMELTLTSAKLSSLVYTIDPPTAGYDLLKTFNAGKVQLKNGDFFVDVSSADKFNFLNWTEPDHAFVAKKDGYCYGVFRGTTLTVEDWSQNLELGEESICGSDATTGEEEPAVCCTVRSGFYNAYHADYYRGRIFVGIKRECASPHLFSFYFEIPDFETALRHCAKDCLDPDECVVLTGHSQGELDFYF